MTQIQKFITYLEKRRPLPNTRNLYRGKKEIAHIRKANLLLYLEQMKIVNPSVLLLGEAPGYKGCGNTGIAFTSERILKEYDFFTAKAYQTASKNDFESEISATIVWDEITKQIQLPLLWNIFPFHPHKENQLKSNRTPNLEELKFGKRVLKKLLELFEIENIIAVGRKPAQSLQELNINHQYVRHPAHGGKHKFVEGCREVFATLQ
jgi:uracil-DNA glycosylase